MPSQPRITGKKEEVFMVKQSPGDEIFRVYPAYKKLRRESKHFILKKLQEWIWEEEKKLSEPM